MQEEKMITITVEEGLWDQRFTIYSFTMPEWVWQELQSRGYDKYTLHEEGTPPEFEDLIIHSETQYYSGYYSELEL